MRQFACCIALAALPNLATAEQYQIGDLIVDHPVAKTTPATAMTGAGYLTITNRGDTPDSLVSVEAAFPRVEIHDTKVENDIASMFRVDAVEIAPGETVTFMPGGKHVMFMGLDGDPFEEGETIAGTLVFENAGTLDIVFTVETLEQIRERIGIMDHGKGDHATH